MTRRQGRGDYAGGSTLLNGGDGSWFSEPKRKIRITAKAYAKPAPTPEDVAARSAHDAESLGPPRLLRKADTAAQKAQKKAALAQRQASRFAKNKRSDEVADAKVRGAEKRARQERIARRAASRAKK